MPIASRFSTRALFLLLLLHGAGRALTLDYEKATHATLSAETVTLTGRSELHITGSGDPIPGTIVHLNSEDAWVFLHGVTPSATVSNLLGRFRVNGAVAAADTNVRVVQHLNGTVVIPHPANFQPLQVFTGPHFSGASAKIAPYSTSLGGFNDTIRSFILKRGYTATFAANANGTGVSRNFVAQDADLEVSLMPAGLDATASFVRVFPWRWVSKKGSCDVSAAALNAKWHYNWNISLNSPRDWEYVAIKQQPFWPGLNQNWQTRGVNHLLGFNEPDNPVEDAWKNLTPQGSVSDAVARWPELLGTGLRVGAPAVTDGGTGWITSFINQADAAGHRVDYVPVHYYRSFAGNDPAGAANQMYNFLRSIYDVARRPIWVTEFNNGANWTNNVHDPNVTQNRNVIQAMIQMMDNTPWIERYAVYSRVEWFRQTHYDDGGITPMGEMYRDHQAPMAYLQAVPNTGSSGNAAYLFEGNTRDILSGNNPLVYGTPKFVPGKNGTALSFDGTDDYLALPGRLGDSNDFSFSAWVRWNGGANWQRVFDLGNGTANNLFLTPRSGGNTLRFAIKLNNGAEQQLNAPPLTPGVWTHVAVTIAGDTGKLFVNGSLVNTNPAMTINPSQIGTETNHLGKSQWPDPLFGGLLDDVRFFNSALTDSQVAGLAAASPVSFPADPVTAASSATPDLTFTGSLAAEIAGGTPPFTFGKISGPAWLAVAADGSLTGVPGLADAGLNSFLVRVTDANGTFANTSLKVPVAAPDLVARYPFDSSPLSAVGGTHATLSGGPGYTASPRGQALDLDGGDDHAVLPPGIAHGDEITLATWVQWDGGGQWQRILDFGNGTDSYLFLTPRSGGNTLRFAIRNGGVEEALNAPQLAAGVWTHLAVTLSGNTGRLFVNGTQVDIKSDMTIRPSDIRPAINYLGRSQFASDPYFDGRVDDLLIFSRALSPAQIAELPSATAPVFAEDPIKRLKGTPGQPYAGSIAGSATVSSGPVSYSKSSGPAWLTVEPDGRISGVPGPADAGNTPFRVRAVNARGIATEAVLELPVFPPDELRLHYPFAGNARDFGRKFHGTVFGSPAYTRGIFDPALGFDGIDDHVQLPANVLGGVTEVTFAARFRWDGGGQWQRIFDFGNNTTQYLFLTPRSGAETLRFGITTGGTGGQQVLDAPLPAVGEWTHVAVTLSGNTGSLYVNGALVDSKVITLNPSNISPTLNYLGRSQWPDPYLNGAIDDFRILDRALAATEVRALAVPVGPTLVPRSGYDAWAATMPFAEGEDLPDFDADSDGIVNVLEWLFGTDPLAPNDRPLVTPTRFAAAEFDRDDGKTYLGFTARLLKNRPGITLIPEVGATLDELGTPASATLVSQAGPPLDDGEFEIFTWYYDVPIAEGSTGFIRLRVLGE